MALVQETELLLLDEPTTFLDIAHQFDVLDLLLHPNRDQGRTVVVVLHDLNLACRHASHVIAMRDGRIVAAGAPSDVIDAESVRTRRIPRKAIVTMLLVSEVACSSDDSSTDASDAGTGDDADHRRHCPTVAIGELRFSTAMTVE